MTSTLDRLAGAMRADVLPGYILSEPRLREIGAVESEFQRQGMAAAEDAERFLGQVEAGRYQYGASEFVRVMHEGDNPMLMIAACLWRHADIPDLRSLIESAPDLRALMSAVYDLWGFVPRRSVKSEGGPAKPIDWKGMIRGLRKLGLSREQAMNLTWAQALNELGWDADGLDADEVQARMLRHRHRAFDRVCREHNLTPESLAALAPQEVLILIAKVYPSAKFNPERLPEMIRTYIERKKRG